MKCYGPPKKTLEDDFMRRVMRRGFFAPILGTTLLAAACAAKAEIDWDAGGVK